VAPHALGLHPGFRGGATVDSADPMLRPGGASTKLRSPPRLA